MDEVIRWMEEGQQDKDRGKQHIWAEKWYKYVNE